MTAGPIQPTRSAAASLEGLKLPGEWTVGNLVPRVDGRSGGQSSVSYLAERPDGTRGFLKALDFRSAMALPDGVDVLSYALERYRYERDLMQLSGGRRMRRVVRALDSGTIAVPGYETFVPYLIFERGQRDLREHLAITDRIDDAWRMRLLHQIAVGLQELHGAAIAHQDLKPSNVVHFGPSDVKVADLGRSICRTLTCPYEDDKRVGDSAYAPPEALYSYVPAEWIQRRYGCDLYLLGSMATFLFTGSSMTTLLLGNLSPEHRPDVWRGGFEAVLPCLCDSFAEVLEVFTTDLREPIREKLGMAVRQLCEPDPSRRGQAAGSPNLTTQYSVQTYVSLFDRLAFLAQTSVVSR